MGRAETTVSPVASGAGREVDLYWPSQVDFAHNGVNPAGTIIARNNIGNGVGGALTSTNGNPGFNVSRGGSSIACATFGALVDGAPNGVKWMFDGMTMRFTPLPFHNGATTPNLGLFEQINAWRIVVIAQFNNPGVALGGAIDNGFELVTVGSVTIDDGEMFRNKTPGIGFRCVNNNQIQACWLDVAGNNPVTQLLVTPAAFLSSDFHAYELRVIGAQGDTPAVARWIIDGQVLLNRNWNAGGMPLINQFWNGLRASAVGNGGFATDFGVKIFCLHGATNEANLL